MPRKASRVSTPQAPISGMKQGAVKAQDSFVNSSSESLRRKRGRPRKGDKMVEVSMTCNASSSSDDDSSCVDTDAETEGEENASPAAPKVAKIMGENRVTSKDETEEAMTLNEALGVESAATENSPVKPNILVNDSQSLQDEIAEQRKLNRSLAEKLKEFQLQKSLESQERDANFLRTTKALFCGELSVKIDRLDTSLLNESDLKLFQSWTKDKKTRRIATSQEQSLNSQVNRIKSELREKDEVIRQQSAKIEAFSSQLQKLQGKGKNETDTNHIAAIEALEKQKSELKEILEHLDRESKAEIARKDGELSSLSEKTEGLEKQVRVLKRREDTMKAALEKMKGFNEKKDAEATELKRKVEELEQKSAQEASKQLDSLISASSDNLVSNISIELDKAKEVIGKLKTDLGKAQREKEELITDMKSKLALGIELDKAKSDNERMKELLKKAKLEILKLNEDMTTSHAQFQEQQNKLGSVVERVEGEKEKLSEEIRKVKEEAEKLLETEKSISESLREGSAKLSESLKTCVADLRRQLEQNDISVPPDATNLSEIETISSFVSYLVSKVGQQEISLSKMEAMEKVLAVKEAALKKLESEKSDLDAALSKAEEARLQLGAKLSQEKQDHIKFLETLKAASSPPDEQLTEKAHKLEAENAALKAKAEELQSMELQYKEEKAARERLDITLFTLTNGLRRPPTSTAGVQTEDPQIEEEKPATAAIATQTDLEKQKRILVHLNEPEPPQQTTDNKRPTAKVSRSKANQAKNGDQQPIRIAKSLIEQNPMLSPVAQGNSPTNAPSSSTSQIQVSCPRRQSPSTHQNNQAFSQPQSRVPVCVSTPSSTGSKQPILISVLQSTPGVPSHQVFYADTIPQAQPSANNLARPQQPQQVVSQSIQAQNQALFQPQQQVLQQQQQQQQPQQIQMAHFVTQPQQVQQQPLVFGQVHNQPQPLIVHNVNQQPVVHVQQQVQQQQFVRIQPQQQQFVRPQQPQVPQQQPQVSQPQVSRPRPQVSRPQPQVSRPQPQVSQPRPQVSQPQLQPQVSHRFHAQLAEKAARAERYFMSIMPTHDPDLMQKCLGHLADFHEGLEEELRTENRMPNFEEILNYMKDDTSNSLGVDLRYLRAALNLAYVKVSGTSPDFERYEAHLNNR